jgi:hypothetical protein
MKGLTGLSEYGILPSIIVCQSCFKFAMQAGIEIAKLFLDEGEIVSDNPCIIYIWEIFLSYVLVE